MFLCFDRLNSDYFAPKRHEKSPECNLNLLLFRTLKFGAENGIRTRDPQLGKLMLYQLSYFRIVLD